MGIGSNRERLETITQKTGRLLFHLRTVTWQAFATLITGFAAVGGATLIGLRQHGLAREQARIADRQAGTAETAAYTAKMKLHQRAHTTYSSN